MFLVARRNVGEQVGVGLCVCMCVCTEAQAHNFAVGHGALFTCALQELCYLSLKFINKVVALVELTFTPGSSTVKVCTSSKLPYPFLSCLSFLFFLSCLSSNSPNSLQFLFAHGCFRLRCGQRLRM